MYSIVDLITANFLEKIKSDYCAFTFSTGKLVTSRLLKVRTSAQNIFAKKS